MNQAEPVPSRPKQNLQGHQGPKDNVLGSFPLTTPLVAYLCVSDTLQSKWRAKDFQCLQTDPSCSDFDFVKHKGIVKVPQSLHFG